MKRKEIVYPTTSAEKYLMEGSGLHFKKCSFQECRKSLKHKN